MIRNRAGQTAGAQVINATSGSFFSGVVTVYVTGDGGVQTIGSVGGGLATHEGQGYYTYQPAAAETDYASVAFTFTGTGAINATTTYDTLTVEQAEAINTVSSPTAITARDLVTKALRRIGVVGAGQALSAEDASDGLFLLNALLDSLALERLAVPYIARSTWPIVSGTGTYTVGDGGEIDMDRPVFVEDVRFQDTSVSPAIEMSLEELTDRGYAAVPQKGADGAYPTAYYYNPTFSGTGLGSLTLLPTPTSGSLEGVIYAGQALVQVASLNTTINLQPGYRLFLIEHLALICAPEWGIEPPPTLVRSAAEAKANIKRGNIRIRELATIEGSIFGAGVYDINSDRYQ